MILIVCLRSIWMIYRYPLSRLMHQEKIGQINYSRLTKRRQFLGILGPICLLAGYFIAFDFRNLATGIVYKQLNDSLDISIPMIITLTPLSFWVSVWWERIYFSVIPCILSFAYLIIEKMVLPRFTHDYFRQCQTLLI